MSPLTQGLDAVSRYSSALVLLVPSLTSLLCSLSAWQDKVQRIMYVWALCRDQEELNPYAAWRLLDISASSTEQIL